MSGWIRPPKSSEVGVTVPDRTKPLGPRALPARMPAVAAATLFVVLAAGITFAAWRIQEDRRRQVEETTEVVAGQARSHLSAWVDARLALVEQLARHWPKRYAENKDEFRHDAGRLVERLEGVQAINWIDTAGVIQIVVPRSGNEAAHGQSLAENPQLAVREALGRAESSGQATRTPAIELLQGGAGFATYWPVRAADGTRAGFVNGVFRINELVRASRLGPDLREEYRFRLSDVGGDTTWSSEPGPHSAWPLAVEHSIAVLDRQWMLSVAPSPASVARIRPKSWALALLTGCYLATALLAWLAYGHLRRHETIRRSELALRALLDELPHFVSVKDPQGRFLVANRALAASYDGSSASLIGKRQREVHTSVAELEHIDRCERAVLERDEPVRVDEEDFTESSGRKRILATVRVPFRDPRSGQPAVLSVGVDVSDRHRAEELRATLATAMDQAGEAIVVLDPRGRIVFANSAFATMMGSEGRDVRGLTLDAFVNPESGDRDLLAEITESLREGRTWSGRYTTVWTDGSRHARDATVSPVRDAAGRLGGFIGVLRDITREQRLEEELRQSHKMEAIGRLAGGVAHDFNNLLTVVLSCAETLQQTLPADSPDQESVLLIADASERAAELTRHLLAFSRQQTLTPKVVDLGGIVRALAPMLERIVGPRYRIDLQLEQGAVPVEVDPGQVERVVLNLCANARDAMPEGGCITISTVVSDAGSESVGSRPELPAGRYAVLMVADTGPGIDPATLERIFDPFFTTKDVGAGTGLGLSTVYGIAEQSGGAVQVRSAVGSGTALSLWFPLHELDVSLPAPQPPPAPVAVAPGLTVLVAEDDPAIRALVTRALSKAGYRVIAASDGVEALERAKDPETLSLLLTDLAMPRMGGVELRDRLCSQHPELPVLFMSGFVSESAASLSPAELILEKPFHSQELLARVRALLG
jgi:PAS domain S-box-containing protein